MFGFGKSTTAAETSETPQPPSREQRQLCWNKRDEYFACLDKHGIIQPAEGELGDKEGKCTAQRTSYEGSCGRSWVDYFNKRRVLEIRSSKTIEAAAKQREEAEKKGFK